MKCLKNIEQHQVDATKKSHYALRQYRNRQVIIPDGHYKGRLGIIRSIDFDMHGRIIACCLPFKMKGPVMTKETIWNWHSRNMIHISDEDIKEVAGDG